MDENHIYQYSLVNALMAGVVDSGLSVQDLLSKGNQGIGTFAHMRGELLMLDGEVHQLLAEGKTRVADESDQIPYAVVTQFVAQETIEVQLKSKDSIEKVLDGFNKHSANVFMTYRFQGNFRTLKCRTVKGQEYDGQPLSEVGKNQHVQDYENIEGTIVGFRSPEIWQGFFVAGEHMHFLSADKTVGGHILELGDAKGTIGVATSTNVHIELPSSQKFNETKLALDNTGIRAVEG
ncbi:hypothetical protein LTR84_008084 [Exophiala bonariae]|uniref:Alpha-acetolactate decarboxylase n=1 Tax=Exophiala bonariae TaxID=1690606 RepID=A0AAV9NMA8_9EURO|nr:hypothetical protein LTR84_008084 [Exophiala bonariae]